MIIKCTGETGRDAYRRNRASWNNETIGGESVKGETTVIANAVCRALKAQKSRHSIVDRSFVAGEFPRSSDKGIASLNCGSVNIF